MPTNRKENLEAFISEARLRSHVKRINETRTLISQTKIRRFGSNRTFRIGMSMLFVGLIFQFILGQVSPELAQNFRDETVWLVILSMVVIAIGYLPEFYSSPSKFKFFVFAGYTFALIGIFAIAYQYNGVMISGSVSNSYLDGLYLSFITWSTVGYGDALPVGSGRYYAMAQGLVSYLMMTVLIAKLIFYVERVNAEQR